MASLKAEGKGVGTGYTFKERCRGSVKASTRAPKEGKAVKRRGLGLLILILVGILYNLSLARTLTITAPSGTVRSGPGMTYNIVGQVAKTAQYEVIEEQDGWYKIRLEEGTDGWVTGHGVTVSHASRGFNLVSFPRTEVGQHRVALVIGNAKYRDNRLNNPVNDAEDMAALLRQLGFGVTLLRDADKRTMDEAIETFTTHVPPNSVGLFIFSGHGVEIGGVNYLLPVGGAYSQPSDVKYGAVQAQWVLDRMEDAGMRVKLLILDACRNNPFSRSWSRGTEGGLAQMDAPTGTLIAYSTSPKKTAEDGTGRNSPYTTHLLRQIAKPGQPVIAMFQNVRDGVLQETHGKQTPWEATSLRGNFYFKEAVQVGGLAIRSRVSRVEVWVGAEKIGETQADRALNWDNLPPGTYRVQARKPGYEPWAQEVEVLAHERTAVLIDIKPIPEPPVVSPERPEAPRQLGGLSIRGRVSGVEVWVNTDKIGETKTGRALTWDNLPPGTYRVQARKPGYASWERKVTVGANQRTEVLIDINALPMPPAVQAEPSRPQVVAQPAQGRPLIVAPTP
jgi:uncharacterized protein YraI